MRFPKSDRAKQILADPKRAADLLRHVTGEKPKFQNQLLAVMREQDIYDLRKVAVQCEVAVSTVFRWLEGTTAPPPKVQEGLLALLGKKSLTVVEEIILEAVQKYSVTSYQLLQGVPHDSRFRPPEVSVRVVLDSLVERGLIEEKEIHRLVITPEGAEALRKRNAEKRSQA